MPQFSPLEHYVYPVLDVECCCQFCVTWREQRAKFDEAKMVTFDHNRSCMCWRCVRRRQLQQGFLAAASKRELFCELSWHASRHAKTYGPKLMHWARDEIGTWPESDGWWATIAQAYSLSFWLSRFQSSVYPTRRPSRRTKLNGCDLPAPRPESVEISWCGWCGDDLPEGRTRFCSDDCRDDNEAYESTIPRPRKVRLRLSDILSGSGVTTMVASGMAA